jgi:hypothetical protein
MVRTTFAVMLLTLLGTSACITSRVGPGVVRRDWSYRPRDPDPLANPAADTPARRWGVERRERIPGPGEAQPPPGDGEGEGDADDGDSTAVDLGKRTLATALAAGFGWLPILESSGTFEEDSRTRSLHRQRRERAARRRAERSKHRVDRAPAR